MPKHASTGVLIKGFVWVRSEDGSGQWSECPAMLPYTILNRRRRGFVTPQQMGGCHLQSRVDYFLYSTEIVLALFSGNCLSWPRQSLVDRVMTLPTDLVSQQPPPGTDNGRPAELTNEPLQYTRCFLSQLLKVFWGSFRKKAQKLRRNWRKHLGIRPHTIVCNMFCKIL